MIDKILEYQKLDGNKVKIEKALSENENKKQATLMVKFVKEAQSKALKMDEEAAKLKKEFEKLSQVEQKGLQMVEKYVNQKTEGADLEGLEETLSRMQKVLKQLSDLEDLLRKNKAQTEEIIKAFDTLKNKLRAAKIKHKENKDLYEAELAKKGPEIKATTKSLEEMEKTLDKELLAKYKAARKVGIYPVFVPLEGNSCGGCRISMASAKVDEIKRNGHIECYNCKRMIYNK